MKLSYWSINERHNTILVLELFYYCLSNKWLLLLNKCGSSKKIALFPQLESILINLSLVLEWFHFLIVKYITLITKQAQVLKEYGTVSLVGIHSDQFKFGIRIFFYFVKYMADNFFCLPRDLKCNKLEVSSFITYWVMNVCRDLFDNKMSNFLCKYI